MSKVNYTFQLVGDYKAKLAELADVNNVISIDPLKANKADSGCYFMYQLMLCSQNVTATSATINKLHDTVALLNTKVIDLEKACNEKDLDIAELKRDIVTSNIKMQEQQVQIDNLLKRADASDHASLELERHSRSSNLRIMNIAQSEGENCKEKLTEVLREFNLEHVDIENCHRVGAKVQGKPQCLIVRFVRRPERREVLLKRKEFFEKGFPLYEDLP